MLDISSLTQKYGLSPQEAKQVEASFQALPAETRENFGEIDFKSLLANHGLQSQLPELAKDRPDLETPKTLTPSSAQLEGLASTATPGAAIMALLTKSAAEQRQANKEIKAAESKAVADTIMEQASEMREKAVVQLVMGVASGTATIAGGAITAGKSSLAMGQGLSQGQAMLSSTQIGGLSTSFQGGSTVFSTISQFSGTMYDASIKEQDASIERSRSTIESLKDVNEALTELIRKSLSTAESMQETTNQTRTRILA
jgi:hypothetical protein